MARMKEHIDISIDVPAGRTKKKGAKSNNNRARRSGGASTSSKKHVPKKRVVAEKKKSTPVKKKVPHKTAVKRTTVDHKQHTPAPPAHKKQSTITKRPERRGFLASLFAPRTKSNTVSGSLFRIKRPPYTNHTVDQLGDKGMMLSMEASHSKKARIYDMQVLHDEAIFVHAPDGEVVWEADLIEYPTFFKEEKYMKDQYDIVGLQRHLHSTGVLPKGAELKLSYRDKSPHSRKYGSREIIHPDLRRKMQTYVYMIDLDERGTFMAHVEDSRGRIVWSVDTDDYPEFFEDGWMRNTHDLKGLLEYLVDLHIVPPTASLTTEDSLRDGGCHTLGDRIVNPEHVKYADAVNAKFLRLKAVFGNSKPRAYPGGKHGIMVKRFIPASTGVKHDELAKNYPIGMGPKGLDAYFKRNYGMSWQHFLTTPSEDLQKPMQISHDAIVAKTDNKKTATTKRKVVKNVKQAEEPKPTRKQREKRTTKDESTRTHNAQSVRKRTEKEPPAPVERKQKEKKVAAPAPVKTESGSSDTFDEKIAAIENMLKKALD